MYNSSHMDQLPASSDKKQEDYNMATDPGVPVLSGAPSPNRVQGKMGKLVVPVGWSIYVISMGTMFWDSSFGGVLGWSLVIASTFMAGLDLFFMPVKVLGKSKLDLSRIDRQGTVGWMIFIILVWILFFPVYLIRRNRLANAAAETIANNLYFTQEEYDAYRKSIRGLSPVAFVSLFVLGILLLLLLFVFSFSPGPRGY